MRTMTRRTGHAPRLLLALLLGLGLAGCGEGDKAATNLGPVAFHPSDECHVCGMVISEFPGPKGEAVARDGVKKFCSTAELFGWWLQPENRRLELQLYVHDMGKSAWDKPDDHYLIDARKAWYVVGTPLQGSMGASLASFADEPAARRLAEQYGGRVLRFEQIDQALLQQAAGQQHDMAHDHAPAPAAEHMGNMHHMHAGH